MAFGSALIDIVGDAGAKDPFSGTRGVPDDVPAIAVPDFARTLDRLLELELIEPDLTCISLHNRGEPVLHPDLDGIVAAMIARNLPTVITTSACRPMTLRVPTAGFRGVLFWVPGWSQASFDRVHGLAF